MNNCKNSKKNIKGFSLVELSVVLTVIGVTLSGALTLAIQKTESDKIAETNKKMDAIEKALELYLIPYWGLSFVCPADGTLTTASSSYGVAGTASSTGCANNNFNNSGSGGNVYAGVVPVKTLFLPDDYMFDGWGRKFTFVIDYRFANNRWTNAACNVGKPAGAVACFKYTSNGSIQINDSTGTAITTTAVYVLISHGKNGNGAWKHDVGSRLAASADAGEMSNAGNDSGAFDNIFVQKDTTSTFDDIVRYKTKTNILSSANAVTDSAICNAANGQVYSTISPLPCAGAPNTNCANMAGYIDIMCADM